MIEAQEMLKQMNVVGTPHMKKEHRERFHRKLHKQAYPKTYDGPAIGPQDLAKLMGAGRLNG